MSYSNYNYSHRQRSYGNGHAHGHGHKGHGGRSGDRSYGHSSSGHKGDRSHGSHTPNNSSTAHTTPNGTTGRKKDHIHTTRSDMVTYDTSSSLKVAKNELMGTDMHTGINSHDENFAKLLLHSDFDKYVPPDPKTAHKNYKVAYDPELDKTLSKADKKSKHIKLKYSDPNFVGTVADPRLTFQGGLDAYMNKPNKRSKKFPFRQLPQAKFVFDKDSLGPPPLCELVIWDVPSTVSEVYLSNYFKSYGNPIKDLRSINDSKFGVSLGIVTFKFQGNTEKASRLAEQVVQDSKLSGIKIDGVYMKIGLNDHDNKLLDAKVKAAEAKLLAHHEKLQEEKKKKAKLLQEQKAKEEQEKARLEKARLEKAQEAAAAEKEKKQEETPEFTSNITILSKLSNNKQVPGHFLPRELEKYVKSRPYILIRDKYIPGRTISSSDLKKALSKYSWTRILAEREGFFIVFNTLKECERCFYKEDASKFYEYRMIMELCIPEGFKGDQANSHDHTRSIDVVNEAANMLTKDFEAYLRKDIRERVIAPVILDLLADDKYPEIINDLRAKEAAQKKEIKAAVSVNSTTKLKEEALSVLAARRTQVLPTFKKKPLVSKSEPKKRAIIPMSHALNYDDNSDDSDGESSRSMTPVATSLKRQLSSATSVASDNSETKEPPSKKSKKLTKKSFLYDSSGDEMEVDEDKKVPESITSVVQEAIEEQQVAKEIEEEEADQEQIADEEEPEAEVDYSSLDESWHPTEDFPRPVCEDDFEWPVKEFNLDQLKLMVKDEEDLELVKEVMKDVQPDESIKNLQYWAWKLKESERNAPDIVEDGEEDILPLDARLESSSGSFRSEGYKKIPDSDKIEYLPHRRKAHKPLKTIQHEDDDVEKSGGQQASNTHSSRVNRANNRRFAADISAQKQMIGSETDILNLNSLTKRKKPVSFARSAIHNWGLYALEPIAAKEMIIEYVGESIRQQVAEHRERSYLKTGIGSSYLFRIDENTVIDATKKGGIARFINHCCSPSCTAKIIKVDGKKRIVIYALRDIDANEELTYDYKFERETNDNERIRCLCGAPGCKGWLN